MNVICSAVALERHFEGFVSLFGREPVAGSVERGPEQRSTSPQAASTAVTDRVLAAHALG